MVYIRRAEPHDAQYIEATTHVVNAAYRSEGGWTNETKIIHGERCSTSEMKDFICNNGNPHTLLLAFDDENNVIGTLQIQHSGDNNHDEAELGLFSVKPTLQSRGIGSQLIQQAMSEMKKLGYSVAVMHVLENRPELLAWYYQLGFAKTGERIPFMWPETLKIKSDLHFLTLKKSLQK